MAMVVCISRLVVWLLVLTLILGSGDLRAQEDADLYKAVAFVTGTEELERSRGFRDGLKQAIVKLTGDADLADSLALSTYLGEAASFVASFEYEDRMKGIPVHDEQGTRERPHFLRIAFDKAKLDNILAELNLKKWTTPRPRLVVFLGVVVPRGSFVLTPTADAGYGQREVLQSVSEKHAIPIALPPSDNLVSVEAIETNQSVELQRAAKAAGGDCPLSGMLKLDAKGIFWEMHWTLRCRSTSANWALSGVTYDKAIASGLERSAALLSKID